MVVWTTLDHFGQAHFPTVRGHSLSESNQTKQKLKSLFQLQAIASIASCWGQCTELRFSEHHGDGVETSVAMPLADLTAMTRPVCQARCQDTAGDGQEESGLPCSPTLSGKASHLMNLFFGLSLPSPKGPLNRVNAKECDLEALSPQPFKTSAKHFDILHSLDGRNRAIQIENR